MSPQVITQSRRSKNYLNNLVFHLHAILRVLTHAKIACPCNHMSVRKKVQYCLILLCVLKASIAMPMIIDPKVTTNTIIKTVGLHEVVDLTLSFFCGLRFLLSNLKKTNSDYK